MTALANDKTPISRPILTLDNLGLAKDIVDELAQYSEADPAAMVVETLVAAGSAFGPGPYLDMPGNSLYSNLYAVVAGPTANGRKGTAWSNVSSVYEMAQPGWLASKVHEASPSSGVALVQLLADHPGNPERERLLKDDEFSRTLATARKDPKLSGNIRAAWDGRTLHNDAVTNRIVAHDPHLSIIADITPGELAKFLERDKSTGFWNRFIFSYSQRSKVIVWPDATADLAPIADELAGRIEAARTVGPVKLDDNAKELYTSFRLDISWEDGKLADFYARRAPQVLKLALVLSLLNNPDGLVRGDDMLGALKVWQYSSDTLWFLHGSPLDNPVQGSLIPTENIAPVIPKNTPVKDKDSKQIKPHIDGDMGLWEFLQS